MKKIIVMISMMFVMSSCWSGEKTDDEVTEPIINNEVNEMLDDDTVGDDSEGGDDNGVTNSTGAINELTDPDEGGDDGEESDIEKTEEEVVKEFEEELDALFDLLENEE